MLLEQLFAININKGYVQSSFVLCITCNIFTSGLSYFTQAHCKDEGLNRVGWSTLSADHNLGTCKQGYGFGGTGKKSNCRQFDTYGEPFTMHDVIGCYLDMDEGNLIPTQLGLF